MPVFFYLGHSGVMPQLFRVLSIQIYHHGGTISSSSSRQTPKLAARKNTDVKKLNFDLVKVPYINPNRIFFSSHDIYDLLALAVGIISLTPVPTRDEQL